jgi:hypothetical protein
MDNSWIASEKKKLKRFNEKIKRIEKKEEEEERKQKKIPKNGQE